MHRLALSLSLIVGAIASARTVSSVTLTRPASARCTMAPGRTLALLRVERDTTLPFAGVAQEITSYTVRPGSLADTMLATPGMPMPAARVRLLQLDDATRRTLVQAGITDSQPMAYIRAAPFGADCRTTRWHDSLPWTRAGDVGFARATLAPRAAWVNGTPVFVIPEAWSYPYPRQRALAFEASPGERLTPPEAMFSLHVALEPIPPDGLTGNASASDTSMRTRAMAWARANPEAAELQPARTTLRQTILGPAWEAVEAVPSRIRGTYRVTMEGGGPRGTWYFRTHDRPSYSWRHADSVRSVADLLQSPFPAGYQLVGYGARTEGTLVSASPTFEQGPSDAMVWLAVADRPTVPGNDTRRTLAGELEFQLSSAPEALWDQLEGLVPPMNVMDSTMLARMGHVVKRGQRQARVPMVLRIAPDGVVRGDTSLVVNGARLRVLVERMDTTSVRRPW